MSRSQRVRALNERPEANGTYLLYWMQRSQRASFNHALEESIRLANERRLCVVVGFGLTDDYPEANARHYAFMLEGLRDVADGLSERKVKFVMRRGSPDEVAADLARDAALVVCDKAYLRHERAWRDNVAAEATCRVLEVEADAVVPVELASDKRETAARTLRPKIERLREKFLVSLSATEPRKDARHLAVKGDVDPRRPKEVLESLSVDHSVRPVRRFRGGEGEARRRLRAFVRDRVEGYAERRREPAAWHSSLLSPYLHFGQISPVEVALAVQRSSKSTRDDRAGFLEELIVRRELALNFVHYTSDYDRYAALPGWARTTLAEHRDDERQHLVTRPRLEAADSHDPYWNAAMREMVHTGFMHNSMRMYWGKKILEWSRTPERAFRTALELNNRYFLDGRDPNSYANVAWCFGLHDRAWTERAVYGKVRYMNDRGLERKFDMDAYVEEVKRLVDAER